jgi:hypothetical protein
MQGHLSQERGNASASFRGQQGPDRCRQIAHRGIQANAPGRIALQTRFSAIRPDPSIYERHREWDIERAFRSLKTVDLEVRPIFHWASPRVKAHVLLCMLAYYVEHHMRARLAPILYDNDDREAAAKLRTSVVAKAQRSPAALRKETTGLTEDGLPVHSFQSLLADLATYCRMQAATALNENYVFTVYSRPTPIQARAFELLGVKPDRTQ